MSQNSEHTEFDAVVLKIKKILSERDPKGERYRLEEEISRVGSSSTFYRINIMSPLVSGIIGVVYFDTLEGGHVLSIPSDRELSRQIDQLFRLEQSVK